MTRLVPFAAVAVFGCAQQAEPAAQATAAADVRVVVAAPAGPAAPPPTPVPPAKTAATPAKPQATQTPKPPEPPAAFEYPADLGGRAVARAVTPDKPALTPTERFGTVPKPHAPPRKLLDPDPLPKAHHTPPPLFPAKAADVRPHAPAERVPVDLGIGSADVPARPTFPVAPGISERARDVALPPALPVLGRPHAERVSLDDPTSEFGNAAVVAPQVKAVLAAAPFLRVSLPDPFELGEQVRPKVAPKDEPGLVPVVVNPQRVK